MFDNLTQILIQTIQLLVFNIDIATARTLNSKNESNDDIVLDANKKKFNDIVKMIKSTITLVLNYYIMTLIFQRLDFIIVTFVVMEN